MNKLADETIVAALLLLSCPQKEDTAVPENVQEEGVQPSHSDYL